MSPQDGNLRLSTSTILVRPNAQVRSSRCMPRSVLLRLPRLPEHQPNDLTTTADINVVKPLTYGTVTIRRFYSTSLPHVSAPPSENWGNGNGRTPSPRREDAPAEFR